MSGKRGRLAHSRLARILTGWYYRRRFVRHHLSRDAAWDAVIDSLPPKPQRRPGQ